MRNITEIIIHSTATPEGRTDSLEKVKSYHEKNGYGYHYLVGINGEVWEYKPEEQVAIHCSGHNQNSIGVCYVGGTEKNDIPKAKDTRTPAQKEALKKLLKELKQKYPTAKIYGHKDFIATACPSFDAKNEYNNL